MAPIRLPPEALAGVRFPAPREREPRAGIPEPPAFRAHPSGAPLACANCANPVTARAAPPMCWGCGRPLCTECYWRHGLTPTAHRCTSCLSHGSEDDLSISGGRSATPAGPR